MNNLRKLGAAAVLTFMLGLSALAGEIQTGPCSPTDPGIMQGPPCSDGQAAPDPAAPGIIQTPPAASAASDYLVTELAIGLLKSLLLY